jgi:hypothetical protein
MSQRSYQPSLSTYSKPDKRASLTTSPVFLFFENKDLKDPKEFRKKSLKMLKNTNARKNNYEL